MRCGRSSGASLQELGLGPAKARLLTRQIAEAYMRGRAEGINVFPHQANRALSAEGIAIALALQHGPFTPPPRRAGIEARELEALEVMARGLAHTVTVEAAVGWDDPEHLADLLGALDACPESLGPAGGGPRAPARDRRDPHGQGQDREGGTGDRHPGAPRRDGEARPGLRAGWPGARPVVAIPSQGAAFKRLAPRAGSSPSPARLGLKMQPAPG